VLAFRVVEEFDVIKGITSDVFSGFVCPSPDTLPFQQVEEAFGDGIIMTIPTTAHTVFQIVVL
jgi:hypothetical protein